MRKNKEFTTQLDMLTAAHSGILSSLQMDDDDSVAQSLSELYEKVAEDRTFSQDKFEIIRQFKLKVSTNRCSVPPKISFITWNKAVQKIESTIIRATARRSMGTRA